MYEEEGHKEDFFVPYVWSLVVPRSTLPWDQAAIRLFAPLVPASSGVGGLRQAPSTASGYS